MLRHAPKLAVGGLLLALRSAFFPLLLGEPPVHAPPGARASDVVTIGSAGAVHRRWSRRRGLPARRRRGASARSAAATTLGLAGARPGGAAVILAFALAAAVLFGSGAYLLLKRDLVRVVAGIMLISNAASADDHRRPGLSRGQAAIAARRRASGQRPAAPGAGAHRAGHRLATVALLLALVHRVVTVFRTAERDELAAGEAQHEAELERAPGGPGEAVGERAREPTGRVAERGRATVTSRWRCSCRWAAGAVLVAARRAPPGRRLGRRGGAGRPRSRCSACSPPRCWRRAVELVTGGWPAGVGIRAARRRARRRLRAALGRSCCSPPTAHGCSPGSVTGCSRG